MTEDTIVAVFDSAARADAAISVRLPDAQFTAVAEILDRHHPIDIDERAWGYGFTDTRISGTIAVGDLDEALPTGAAYQGTSSDLTDMAALRRGEVEVERIPGETVTAPRP